MSVSVLLITKDEEANIARCLQSLDWSDDIVVVDSYSGDRTVEIAESCGARVQLRRFETFASQRNYALEQIPFKYEWILHMDADEVCTEELQAEIRAETVHSQFDAFRIASKMMFRGRWLRHASMYPAYQVRLGRHPVFRFEEIGHGQREAIEPSRIGTLKSAYLHYPYRGMQEWLERHNRYSSAEAQELVYGVHFRSCSGLLSRDKTSRRRALKSLSYRLPLRPLLRFVYVYLVRSGFLDGRAGFEYAYMLALYEAMIGLKVREMRLYGDVNS